MEDKKVVKHNVAGVWLVLRWLVWGLRWLAIVVFAALFCAGLFFKLPWKALVCLAIIPAVGIFVPRRIQPWCWLVLAAIAIGAAVWALWPRPDSGRWRTYRYDDALSRLVLMRRIDGMPNAAALYSQVLRDYDESIFDFGYFEQWLERQTFDEPWDAEALPQIAEWLEPIEPALPTLLAAAAVDQCRFPIAPDGHAVRTQLRRINQLKGWGRWLIRSANGDLQAGRLPEALEKQLAVLGIARHLYQQQTLFDQASGFFMELAAARALKRYALDYAQNEDDLDRILAALSRVEPNWPQAWDGIVDVEKLTAKNLAALFYETDDRGRTRIHRNAFASVVEGLGHPLPGFAQHPAIARTTALALWLSLPTTPDAAARLIERRFDKFSDLARRGTPARPYPVQYAWRMGLNPTSAVDWLARQQMSYYAALDGQYKSHLALGRATAITVELKRYFLRHGRWPDALSALDERLGQETFVDPVSGAGFVYGATETGFSLYSLGRNAADDRGLNDPMQGLDDIVFWPLTVPETGF